MEVRKSLFAFMSAILMSVSAVQGANYTLTDEPETNNEAGKMKAPRWKPSYLGTAIVVEGGFELTFLQGGCHNVTITDEDGDVVLTIALEVQSGESVFLSVPMVDPEEDTIEFYF